MPHPKVKRKENGLTWHLEDSKLTACDAQALARHLRNTEGKRARVEHDADGYKVWWATKKS